MVRTTPLVLLLSLLAACGESSYAAGPSDLTAALAEANRRFTHRGQPIRPDLVAEFDGWISDAGPITVAVDLVAAFDTNEYSDEVEVRQNFVRTVPDKDGAWFGYRWLGASPSGTHVLRTAWCGGGSGIFISLKFVRFELDTAYEANGKPRSRLLMKVVREFSLGDRDRRKVQVRESRILVGEGDEKVELRF